MTRILPLSLALVVAGGVAVARVTQPPASPADLIVTNARVYTVDPGRPEAQAVAVRGDRLVVVGTTAEALAVRGPSTQWQALRRSGARLANGSDFPVEEPNPMFGFYAAITRQDRQGQPPGGWMPDQRLTRAEALHAQTAGAAYAAHLEQELGTLRPGTLADLLVLSHDIMQVAPARVLEARPLLTVRGGRVTFRDGL